VWGGRAAGRTFRRRRMGTRRRRLNQTRAAGYDPRALADPLADSAPKSAERRRRPLPALAAALLSAVAAAALLLWALAGR